MATLGESPSAKILREALATVRRDALPISSTVRLPPENILSHSLQRLMTLQNSMLMLRGLFGRSEHTIDDSAHQVQEEVDDGHDVDTPVDQTTTDTPLIVSPDHAKDMISDLPDRSVEEAASIVNDLALGDVPQSPPRPTVLGRRKRQRSDTLDAAPSKRIAMDGGANGTSRNNTTTATDHVAGNGARSTDTSAAIGKMVPGKLPRPRKESQKRHMAQLYPALQRSADIWDPAPSPKKQMEKPASSHTAIDTSPNAKATPRPRGRPPKKKTKYIKKQKSTQRRDVDLRNRQGKSVAHAKAQRANDEAPQDVANDFDSSPRHQNEVVGEENEEEDEEPEAAGRRGPEETIVGNGRTSHQMKEGAGTAEAGEEGSDFEDPTQSIDTDEDDDEVEEEVELFGQDEAWRNVLEGARSVCGPKLIRNQMPKVLTQSIKELVYDVKETRTLYEQVLASRETDRDSLNEVNDHVKESLNTIEDQIRKLSEKTAGTEGREMIRDIFARAIPAMVFLLRSAMVSRTYCSDEQCSLQTLNETVQGLKEISRLLKITTLLCEKATNWKAKPAMTSRPIVRPTTRKMFPNLKSIREAFARRLADQERRRKAKQNAVDSGQSWDELVRSSQHAKQEAGRLDDVELRKLKESREKEDEMRRKGKRTFNQWKEDVSKVERHLRQADRHHSSGTEWSEEEELQLYIELEAGYIAELTSTLIQNSSAASTLFANHFCSSGAVFKYTEQPSPSEQAARAHTKPSVGI